MAGLTRQGVGLERSARSSRGYGLVAVLILAWLAGVRIPAQGTEKTAEVQVRPDGAYVLVVYTTTGAELRRYTGFTRIAALATYDASTVLVAEPEKDLITALSLDGRTAWTVSVQQPRCVVVIEENRFLVCQGAPAALIEIDRSGKVLWQLPQATLNISAAAHLADGSIAVAEGHTVRVFSTDGQLRWTGSGGAGGLALLQSGQIASGVDRGEIVVQRPFSDTRQTRELCCQPLVFAAKDDMLIAAGVETQTVRGWAPGGQVSWTFKIRYPPSAVAILADDTVMVAQFLAPDRPCFDAAAAAQRAARPLAPYWIALFAGLVAGAVVVVVVQRCALGVYVTGRNRWRVARARPDDVLDEVSSPRRAAIRPSRRLGVAACAAGATLLAAAAAVSLRTSVAANDVRLWPYALLAMLAGGCLVLIQYRTPAHCEEWTRRVASLGAMTRPSGTMWTLWILAATLLVMALAWIQWRHDHLAVAAWSGAVVLLVGGAIQAPVPTPRGTVYKLCGCLALFAVLGFIRVYRLENYPPDHHLDMALWTLHTARFLAAEFPTLWGEGYAQIPLAGHLWPALWAAAAGTSVAAARLESAAASILALWGVFLLTRALYGSWAATVSVFLLGVNHAFLHFSRIQAYMDPVPFNVLAVLGLISGIETGRYSWFALAGFAGGYATLSYHSGRITPAVMAAVASLLLVRYPRALKRRWPGLLLCACVFAATVGPYVFLYATGRMYVMGREEVYPWLQNHQINFELLSQKLWADIGRAPGAFWFLGDTSTQFGASMPVFSPFEATLLAMFVVAALLRPTDVRGLLLLIWAAIPLVVGGALTINTPFWPRIVIAFVPAAIAVGASLTWLCRASVVAFQRYGAVIAFAGALAVLTYAGYHHAAVTGRYSQGIWRFSTAPSRQTESTESIMGRDIQRWGPTAMLYIVSEKPIEASCARALTQYYGMGEDLQDAREIQKYMPFEDPRTIVCYFVPDLFGDVSVVKARYPEAEVTPFHDNLGRHIFTRVVINAPHR